MNEEQLRQTLADLWGQLSQAHGFQVAKGDVRHDSVLHLDSTFPVELLLDWLDRCPEARKVLNRPKDVDKPETSLTMFQHPAQSGSSSRR
jgi:hypothetical protein